MRFRSGQWYDLEGTFVGKDQPWLTTEGFFEAIVQNLEKEMGSWK